MHDSDNSVPNFGPLFGVGAIEIDDDAPKVASHRGENNPQEARFGSTTQNCKMSRITLRATWFFACWLVVTELLIDMPGDINYVLSLVVAWWLTYSLFCWLVVLPNCWSLV